MLTRISLKNFKKFDKVDVALAPLTLLMGLNGAGKSSVIQSLLVLRQSHESGSLAHGEVSLSGVYCKLGTARDVFHHSAGAEDKLEFTVERSTEQRTISCTFSGDADRLEAKTGDLAVSLGSLEHERFVYLSAERNGPRLSNPRTLTDARQGRVGASGEGALATLEYYRDTLLRPGDPRIAGEAAGSIYEQTQSYLDKISPGARIELTPSGRTDSISAGYSFADGQLRTESYRPTNVGFGLSYTLPIIVACLTAEPGSLICIENPEAHLHSSGQRAIGDLLRRTAEAGVQVIAETHSREIFSYLKNMAERGEADGAKIAVHYFTSEEGSRIHTLNPITDPLDDWPDEYYAAFRPA